MQLKYSLVNNNTLLVTHVL